MKNSSFSYSRISIEKSIQNSDRKKDVFPYWAYDHGQKCSSTTVVSRMSNCWAIQIWRSFRIFQKFRSEKKMVSNIELKILQSWTCKKCSTTVVSRMSNCWAKPWSMYVPPALLIYCEAWCFWSFAKKIVFCFQNCSILVIKKNF